MPLPDNLQLKSIMPQAPVELWIAELNTATTTRDINTPLRIATFLAHVAVESAELRTVVENLNYSAARLMAVWPNRFPSLEIAAQYASNPEKLGNNVYANRLGNGPPESGDGFRFRGRGLLQATGRDHYRAASNALQQDLIAHPELLEQPTLASSEATWWWQTQGLNELADMGHFRQSTIRINGGLNGYPERLTYWRRALQVLGIAEPVSSII